MSKKKRAVHARSAAAALLAAATSSAASAPSFALSLARNGDLEVEKRRATLAVYAASSVIAEIKSDTEWLTPLALETLVWVHTVVALMIETARVVSEDAAGPPRVPQTVFSLAITWAARYSVPRWISSSENVFWLAKTHLQRVRRQLGALLLRVVMRVAIASAVVLSLLVAMVTSQEAMPPAQWGPVAALFVLVEATQVRFLIRADGQQTIAATVLSAGEVFLSVYYIGSYITDTSNLIVDQLARKLTAVTAATHTLVLLGAIQVLEHATASHASEFQSSKRESAALMARLREAYRDAEDAVGATKGAVETASKRKKKAARAKLAPIDDVLAAESLPASPSLLHQPSVQLGLLLALESLLLVALLALSINTVLAWESMSILILSSSHVAWTLLRLKNCLAAA